MVLRNVCKNAYFLKHASRISCNATHYRDFAILYVRLFHTGCSIFHCDSMKHKVIPHWITMKYAVSCMKMPHVRDCTISILCFLCTSERNNFHSNSKISMKIHNSEGINTPNSKTFPNMVLVPNFSPLNIIFRGIVRLSTSGGQEWNISSFFLFLLLFSANFPHFFLIFFLNLILRVGGSPTGRP